MGEATLQTRVKRGELRKSGDAWDCAVCPSPCPLPQNAEKHLRGAQHEHYLFLQSIKNPKGYQDIFNNLPQSIRDAQRKDILQVQTNKVLCFACDVYLDGKEPLKFHLQSDKHQEKFKSNVPTTSSSVQVARGSPPAYPSPSSGAIAKVARDLGRLPIHQPSPSSSSIQNSANERRYLPTQPVSGQRRTAPEETSLQAAIKIQHIKKVDDNIFYCNLCLISTTGEENMKQHLIGQKHKKILSRIDVTDTPGADTPGADTPGASTDRSNTAYKIKSSLLGIVLVFNYVFRGQTNVRHGAKEDEKNIKEVFEKMKYEVHIFTDCTRKKTMETFLGWIQNQKLKTADSFIVFFLSHGGSTSADEFSTWDKENISVHEISSMLTDKECPNLRGKPKLLFFNFCRGSTEQIHSDEYDCWSPGKKIEAPEDLAIVHATLPFIKSKRSPMTGTLFVKSLCTVLRKHAGLLELKQIINETTELMHKVKGTTPTLLLVHFKDFYFIEKTDIDAK